MKKHQTLFANKAEDSLPDLRKKSNKIDMWHFFKDFAFEPVRMGPKNEATASFFGPKRAMVRSANKVIDMFELNTETD